MPYLSPPQKAGKKRARNQDTSDASTRPRSKAKTERQTHGKSITNEHEYKAKVETLLKPFRPNTEEEGNSKRHAKTREHYNDIAILINDAKDSEAQNFKKPIALLALYEIYSDLLTRGCLVEPQRPKASSHNDPIVKSWENERTVVSWLQERLGEFRDILLQDLYSPEDNKRHAGLKILMLLVEKESIQANGKVFSWQYGCFATLLPKLCFHPDEDFVKEEFVEPYFLKYDDVRYYTLSNISKIEAILSEYNASESQTSVAVANAIAILSALGTPPDSESETKVYFGTTPEKPPRAMKTLHGLKAQVQDAWRSVFRCNLTEQQRKMMLKLMSRRIVPWFTQPELLMDFLTDCYDQPAPFPLLALSGLFDLMVEKNLDYPSFYEKLYSLLDDELLHSKRRSEFFRLLDKFLASTHLPAALVASFIKRLSRLALHAPPAGIVVVVPWIYNMFKRHPACTFMIHREVRDPESKAEIDELGMKDPFNMDEPDPMKTGAIDSCLWEIVSLQSEYHPNVATLAKIISEQFTKQSYNLDDFLDYTYRDLIDAELSKNLKRAPEVEFEIPKRIFTEDGITANPLGGLLTNVFESFNA